jgi:hypothetical protein
MENIIKLIDISLVNGRLNQDDYRIIRKKAQSIGISDEELDLIISKRSEQPQTNAISSPKKSISKLPYIFAILAIAFTFVDWIGFYSRSSVMGSSGTWDTSFTAWWGGYGATVIIIFALGSFLYYKNKRLSWITGIIAIADAYFIYSSISSANVSVSYNYGGYGASSEAGYNLLWGFWAFIIASLLFSLSAMRVTSSNHAAKRGSIKQFKANIQSGLKLIGLTMLISTVGITLVVSAFDKLNVSIIVGMIFSIIFTFFTLIIFFFSSSLRTVGYVLFTVSILLCIGLWFLSGERAETQSYLAIMTFSVIYILLERLLPIKKSMISASSKVMLALMLASSLNIACTNEPRSNFQFETPQSINGTYRAETDGIESSVTIIGNTWYGTHIETNFGNIFASGAGTIDGNKIIDEYGIELGTVSNGKARVNVGGNQITLYKE